MSCSEPQYPSRCRMFHVAQSLALSKSENSLFVFQSAQSGMGTRDTVVSLCSLISVHNAA